MKKFVLFFVVAVMAAAMSQAVSFSWSVSNIKDGEGTKIPAGGFIAYLFNTSDYSVAAATADAKDGKLNVGKALDSSTGTGAGKVVSDEITTSLTGEQTMFAVIFDNPTGNSGNFIVTETAKETIPAVGSATFGLGSQSGATWTPVPEPTTVALLALGLAALGLKRQVA